MERTSIDVIMNYMTAGYRQALEKMPRASDLTEFRLYTGRPPALVYPDCIMYLTRNGTASCRSNTMCIICMPEDIDSILDKITHYSFHSHVNELKQGYIMLETGVRAGLSGQYNEDGIITAVTGISFRISRCVKDCCREILPLFSENAGVLICGGVNSGKTTLLRDACRCVGNRKKVALIDERNEIACTSGKTITNDVGALTNVLSGCERSKGIISAIRALSPDYIFCDEIAGDADVEAILKGAGCGVSFCATIHASGYAELAKREIVQKLLKSGVFKYGVFLKGSSSPGEIVEIRRLDNAD